MLNEDEEEAIEFLKEFRPKIFWQNSIKIENDYVLKDDIYLKNKINVVLNCITKLQNKIYEKDDIIVANGHYI